MYILPVVLMALLLLFLSLSLFLVICQHETDRHETFLASPGTVGGPKVPASHKLRENRSEIPLQGLPATSGEYLLRSSSIRNEHSFSQGLFSGKDMIMNIHIDAKKQGEMAARTGRSVADRERLVNCGFTSEEIVSLLWLQNWYQSGGSDRVVLVRHWEFLRLLVLSGKLDV
jgi:hypothetical protein